jgi:hypothetical protein
MYENTCRVCGRQFRSRRFDALTCTSTCRQRLKRGQAFAYLGGLDVERRVHETHDAALDWLRTEATTTGPRPLSRKHGRRSGSAKG